MKGKDVKNALIRTLRRLRARWTQGGAGQRKAPRPQPAVKDAPGKAGPLAEPERWQQADVTSVDLPPITKGRPYLPESAQEKVRAFYARHAAPSPWRLGRWAL
jgi:hypothetical protein